MNPIETEEDYRLALKRLEVIFDAPIGTPESNEAGELGEFIDEYEKEHYPMEDLGKLYCVYVRCQKFTVYSL